MPTHSMPCCLLLPATSGRNSMVLNKEYCHETLDVSTYKILREGQDQNSEWCNIQNNSSNQTENHEQIELLPLDHASSAKIVASPLEQPSHLPLSEFSRQLFSNRSYRALRMSEGRELGNVSNSSSISSRCAASAYERRVSTWEGCLGLHGKSQTPIIKKRQRKIAVKMSQGNITSSINKMQ